MIDGDELSIFPDQTVFLRPPRRGRTARDPEHPRDDDRRRTGLDPGDASDADRRGRGDLHRQAGVPHPVPGRLEAVAGRSEGVVDAPDDRPAGDTAGVVGAAAGDGADTARPGRCERPAPRRRPADPHRLPRPVRCAGTTARRTRSGSTSPASSSRPSSPSAPSTGATRCCCRAGSRRGGRASSTSTSTTS